MSEINMTRTSVRIDWTTKSKTENENVTVKSDETVGFDVR